MANPAHDDCWWTTQQAARLLNVPYRTMRRWLMDGLVIPRLQRSPQPWERLRLVIADLEEAWCIASLRAQGVSMQKIKRCLVRLADVRLSELKAVIVQGDDVIGLRDGDPRMGTRLTDGQVIDLELLRTRMAERPGEPLSIAARIVLRAVAEGPFVHV